MRGSSDSALMLKELRTRRGWSWRSEAHELKRWARQLRVERVVSATVDSVARTIARWESGRYPYRPDERYQLLLAHVFAVSDGRVALGPGSDFERLMTALAAMGVSLDRRQVLRGLVASALAGGSDAFLAYVSPVLQRRLAVVLDAPQKLDVGTIGQLAEAAAAVQQHAGRIPFARLQTALAPVAEVLTRLLGSAQPPVVRQKLCAVASAALALAGRIAFELRDPKGAEDFYSSALAAAAELDDGWREAAILTSWTMVTLYATGDRGAAQHLADGAVRRALQGSSNRVRARAFAIQGERSPSRER